MCCSVRAQPLNLFGTMVAMSECHWVGFAPIGHLRCRHYFAMFALNLVPMLFALDSIGPKKKKRNVQISLKFESQAMCMYEPDASPNGLSCVNAALHSKLEPIDGVHPFAVASLVSNHR